VDFQYYLVKSPISKKFHVQRIFSNIFLPMHILKKDDVIMLLASFF
jgi:hypothetical protein